MRIKILGKFWNLVFKVLRKDDGYCDPPTQRNKEIQVSSQLRGENKLRVITHEILHAADWHKDEQWVDEVSTDIARVLWRLGYRETSGDE